MTIDIVGAMIMGMLIVVSIVAGVVLDRLRAIERRIEQIADEMDIDADEDV